MTGESPNEASAPGLPPIATPMTVKIPDPITAPMPSAVKDTGPSVFFNACSGLSDSEISLSIDLVAKICLASALAPATEELVRGVSTAIAIQMLCKTASSPSQERCRQCSNSTQLDSLPLALAA